MRAEPPINLRRLRGRGRVPTAGDLFALGLPNGTYIFGRVIDGPLDRSVAPMPGAYLIYVYRHRAAEAAVSSSDLKPGDLLIPPAFVNQLGWTKGYFLPIGSAVVRPEDRLPHPCFFDGLRGTYVDASGQPIEHRSEPCGDWGLGNHRSLDVKISDALGITQAPDR